MAPEGNYLTESRLGNILPEIYPGIQFIHNKSIPNSGLRYRPDYRSPELGIIVEFDGPQHYTNARICLEDVKKDALYGELGYKVVRIPNFIQLETKTIKILFDIDYSKELEFPHGFISKNVVPPADYCELGIERFLRELEFFGPEITRAIGNSLVEKAEILGPKAVINSKTEWLLHL